MIPETYGPDALRDALRETGRRLVWPAPVQIVIAGGAAGMLLGIWSADRVTEDCDIVDISPPVQPREALLRAAREVAEAHGLNADWLNDHFHGFGTLDTLPEGWQQRLVSIGQFGQLAVFSLSRADLLAMKLYAGRSQDVQDVYSQAGSLTQQDLQFMGEYLASLRQPWRKHIREDQLSRAEELLSDLREEAGT